MAASISGNSQHQTSPTKEPYIENHFDACVYMYKISVHYINRYRLITVAVSGRGRVRKGRGLDQPSFNDGARVHDKCTGADDL